MIRINLLPVKAAQKKEQLRNQLVIVVVSLALVVAGCVFVHIGLRSDIDSVAVEIAKNNAEIKSLQKKIGEVNKFKVLQEELKKKLDVLATLKAAKSGPIHLMDDLISSLPENLWITDFKEKSSKISIKGVALSEGDVADFMTGLESSSYYRSVSLSVTKQKMMNGLRLQEFSLSCLVEMPVKK